MTTHEEICALAREKLQRGHCQEAIDGFQKAIALKEHWAAYQGLGTALFSTNQYSEAIDVFQKAIALKEHWAAYQGLGSAFCRTNQYPEAIDAFQKSLALNKDWYSFQCLGGTLLNTNQYPEAIDAFQKSLALHEDWDTYRGLGWALFNTNQYSAAKDAFQKSLEAKETWNSYLGLGWALLNINQYSAAKDAFQKSLEAKETWNSYLGLGWAFFEDNQYPEAIDSFRKSYCKEESYYSNLDETLSFLIGASSYNELHKRVLSNQDIINYIPVENELKNFILLAPWETECLYRYAKYAKQGIVEIGRYKGGSTLLFSLSNPQTRIISIDISPYDDKTLKNIFLKTNSGENVNLLIGDANKVHSEVIDSGFNFDFLFIDGDHSYEGCLEDIKTWFPSLSPGGLIAFHDAFPFYGSAKKQIEENGVFDAIMEFSRTNDFDFIIPPSSTPRVWENPNGSLCIIRKRIN